MSLNSLRLRLEHVLERTVPGLITCAQADAFIDDYLAGRLPPKHRKRFERHLRMCCACRSHLQAYRRTVALAKASAADTARLQMPEDLLQTILAARDTSRD